MTKSLQEIQQENRRLILEAIHGCSYEEALRKELDFGCELKKINGDSVIIERALFGNFSTSDGNFGLSADGVEHYYKIIGKPLTLNRVLLAVTRAIPDLGKRIDEINKIIFAWKLTKETLELQTEETQRQIHNLLNK